MAEVREYEWESRYELLDAFAASYGISPPAKAGEVPVWWTEFEKYFQAKKKEAGDEPVRLVLRTSTKLYDDQDPPEEDDDDNDDDEEPPALGAGEEDPKSER